MTGLLATCGVWLEDEIQASSNPAAHADGIITTMQRERIGWVATNAARTGATMALQHLLDAANRHGYGACGYWNQNMNPSQFLQYGDYDGAQIMIANIESRAEDTAWSTTLIDELHANWGTYHAGVCWTEAAWGKHPDGTYRADLAARWHDGIVSMPEAIQSENPNATIGAMDYVNRQYGFRPDRTSYVLYLTRGYPAIEYNDEIVNTQGRWSVFRYGDIDAGDWAAIATWPRPQSVPEPAPEPTPEPPPQEPDMPRGAATSAYAAMDYWFNSTARPADWRTQNPGEWQKIQAYRAAPEGTPPPENINSNTGKMLLEILEAAKWAEGTHE